MALRASSVVGGSGVTSQATGSFSVVTGDTISVWFNYGNTTDPVSVLDNLGNTYTQRRKVSRGFTSWRYDCVSVATGSCVVTLNIGATEYPTLAAASISGLTASALDIDSQLDSDTSQPWSLATGTLAQADEDVFAWIGADSGTATDLFVETSGMSILGQMSDSSLYWTGALAHIGVASTSSYVPAFTNAAGGSNSVLITTTFKRASGGGSSADLVAAAGVATTSAMVGASTVARDLTAAAGVATAGTLTGAATVARSMTAAAGVATTGTLSGASTVARDMTPAAGAATSGTLDAASTVARDMVPAAGVATTSTMTGSGASSGAADLVPAAGQATSGVLGVSSVVAVSMVPAAGQATTSTMTGSGGVPPPAPAPAPGGSEFGPGGRRTRNFKPILQRMLEERYPRVKPRAERAQKRAKTIEQQGAELVLEGDGTLADFEALAAQWMAQRPVMPAYGLDPLAVYMAQVAFRLRQQQAAIEAAAWRRQQDEDAILVLLLA